MLLFDGTADAVVLTCCGLRGVIDAPAPRPLPRTVACRWPRLLRSTILHEGELILAIDARVLMGLVEGEASHARERS